VTRGEEMPSRRESNEDSGLIFIERSHLFKTLGEDDSKKLLASGRRVRFAPGDVIMREGEEGQTFYLLKSGRVEVTTTTRVPNSSEEDGEPEATEDGVERKVVLATLSPGAFFGEVAVLTGKTRTADVTALDDVETIQFEREVIEALFEEYPRVRELLQAVVIGRARDTITKLRDTIP
jgi:CRP-like cAMP-binding protein